MVLMLTADEVRGVLDQTDVVATLMDAFRQQAEGLVDVPPRITADAQGDKGWLRVGPALLNGSGYMGFKAMNRRPALGVRYLVMLYAIDSGELLVLMDANELTTARTAATNAIGTHLLAREDAQTLGIVGSGVQARAALDQLLQLRAVKQVVVTSPRAASREDFARHITETYGLEARVTDGPGELAAASDIVLLAFRAPTEPVLRAEHLRPGLHVTGLSSVRREAREIDNATWGRSDVVVVDAPGSVFQSGDGRSILAAGHERDEFAELWQLVTGLVGRSSPDQVTLFKSSGDSLQDVAAASAVYERARELGVGRDLGEFPDVKPYD